MNAATSNPIDIERWRPTRWDQIVGNHELKNYWFDLLHCVRRMRHRSGFNALVTGPSRGGKTATIGLGIQSIGCLNLDFETFNPCNECANCTMKNHFFGNVDWENHVDLLDDDQKPTPIRYHCQLLDCARINEAQLEEALGRLRANDDCLRVIYLDEVHRLARRGMDERLLKPMEDFPAIWIASSANIEKAHLTDRTSLEKMLQNRFTYRIHTQKPTRAEMLKWLAERCAEFQLTCTDAHTTLCELIDRSDRNPGMALQVLNKAHKSRTKIVTPDLVREHTFDLDD